MTDPYLRPTRPARHVAPDVQRRFVAPTRRPAQPQPPAEQQQMLEPIAAQVRSLKDHIVRMISTAGMSWATYEHDELWLPLQRLRKRAAGFLPGRSRWWQVCYFAILLIGLIAIPTGLMIRSDLRAQRYTLTSATKQLIGAPVVSLDKQLTYDAKTGLYQYNPGAANGIQPPQAADGDSAISIGGSKYYGVDLGKVASKGQTYTDAQTKLSFSLVPEFGQLDGKHEAGHVVYPTDGGQVIYTLKDNGLKEDVVLSSPTDSATLKYKLQLPSDLQAKLLPDGSVGIYSADSALFGNISYGGSSDQQAVEKARTNGAKTNLVFQIPAPEITDSTKKLTAGKASFSLNGNNLTVTATNLNNLSYPISIDPSVVVTSATGFNLGNNEDNNATITTGSVARNGLSGGTAGAWTTTGSSLPASFGNSLVVVNGRMYSIAGDTAGTAVSSAPITSGALGTFSSTTALPAKSVGGAAVAYNGNIYVVRGNDGTNGTTTVYEATPNSSGTISLWAPVSSLTTAGDTYVSAAVYNDHLYVVDGCVGGSGGTCTVSTSIEYAVINADGSLGTFSSAEASGGFTTARKGAAVFIYNNQFYIVGGATSSTNGTLTGALGDTQYAAISSNGQLGGWNSTSSLPANVAFAGGGVSNGYAYIYGGNAAGSPSATTYYAPIYANGLLGPWATTNSLVAARSNAGSTTYNGYLYIAGGCTTSCPTGVSTSEYSQIGTVGPVGGYASPGTGATNSSALYGPASVASAGYIYLMGGITAGSVTKNSIQYAQIASDGTLGAWSTATGAGATLGESPGLFGAAAVAYNGNIYLSGGSINSAASTLCAEVQYASVNAGVFSAWKDALTNGTEACANADMLLGKPTGAAAGRYFHQMLIYNNFLYIMGGVNQGNSNTLSDVQYAAFCTGLNAPVSGCVAAGTVGPFSYTDSGVNRGSSFSSGMPQSLASFRAVIANGYIYLAGGKTASADSHEVNTIYSAPICTGVNLPVTGCAAAGPVGGTAATWTSIGTLPTNPSAANNNRSGFGMFVNNGYLYINGGQDSVNNYDNDTQYALICTAATITDGCSGANGTLGTWHLTSLFTTARYNPAVVAYNGFVYVADGCTGGAIAGYTCGTGSGLSIQTDVQYAPFNNGGGGNSGTWNTTTAMPYATAAGGSVAYNGYLYVMGGCNNVGCAGGTSNSVYHTTLNADGTIGASWTHDTSLTASTAGFGLVAYSGHIYILGGISTNTVYYATPDPSTGNITSWTPTTSFSVGRNYLAAFAYNGYMYVAGGTQTTANTNCNTVSSKECSDIQYAPITSTGALGAWQFTANSASSSSFSAGFTTGRQNLVTLANNGYVYIVGGYDGTNALKDVQYAKLNSDGTVGSWAATTSMLLSRYVSIGGAYDGYLYMYNGLTTGGTQTPTVEYAPFASNGALGQWTLSAAPITGNADTDTYGSGAIINGYLYYLGGQNTSLDTTVSYAPLQVIARVAHYSRVIDTASTVNGNAGNNVQVTRYVLKSSSSGSGSVCLSFAPTAAFTSTSCTAAFNLDNATNTATSVTKTSGRYVQLFLTIDDSQNAAFPDASPSSISEFDLYFHPAANRRLRGGQTFTDTGNTSGSSATAGSNGQLDTEGTQ